MRRFHWQKYEPCFKELTRGIAQSDKPLECSILYSTLDLCYRKYLDNDTNINVDTDADAKILGVKALLVSYIEYLFHEAEGPYSSEYHEFSPVIIKIFQCFPDLRRLIDLNAADTIANMILNRRGKLKFLIADHYELSEVLILWKNAGLRPVTFREVFEAVMNKATIHLRIRQGDPGLILRLIDVFPEYLDEVNPTSISREDLIRSYSFTVLPPSEKRYRQVCDRSLLNGMSLEQQILREEKRTLPMDMRRNRFLAYLVRRFYNNTCQICSAKNEEQSGRITVHHIIPVSSGGEDKAYNMLVTCDRHHKAIHDDVIKVNSTKDVISVNGPGYEFIVPVFFSKK